MKKILAFIVVLVLTVVILIPTIVTIGRIHKSEISAGRSDKMGEDVFIKVYLHDQGKVVEMKLEEYIAGVVGAEMPAEFELEALKAQAVAARTYAVKNMMIFGGSGLVTQPGADVSTDYREGQAFLSVGKLKERWGTQYEEYWAKINKAVGETRGQVVTYNGELINAVFHSTSGAHTASAKEVWGGDIPYLISVPCPWDQKTPRYSERKEFALSEIEQRLGAETQVVTAAQNGTGVTQVLNTTDSGRVGQIRIGSKILSGLMVREKLDLHSTNFTVEIQGSKMIFNTIGYGHGVGLCQYGANGMAKAGQDYRHIITQYYTGVAIKNIHDS